MLIGLLADSHGRHLMTRHAVSVLLDAGAELLLHLGDVETDNVIDELVGHPARLVFGNCDDEVALARYAQLVNVIVDHPVGDLDVDGRRIVYTHGHLMDPMENALREEADYLLHGHSHELRDERIGRTRVINPGALFRARRYTAALLDPTTDDLRIFEIAPPASSSV